MPTQKQISVTPPHFRRKLLPYYHLQIDDIDVNPELEEIDIGLDLIEESTLVCSVCEEPAAGVHRLLDRRLRDININGNKVYLNRPYRRIHCDECDGTRSQKIYISRRNKELTNRFARYVDQLSEKHDVDRIASNLDLAWKTVESIVNEPVPNPEPGQEPVVYGLDVIQMKQEIREVVVLDYLSGAIIMRDLFVNEESMLDWLDSWADNKSEKLAENDVLLLSEQPIMQQILIDHVGANHVLREFK